MNNPIHQKKSLARLNKMFFFKYIFSKKNIDQTKTKKIKYPIDFSHKFAADEAKKYREIFIFFDRNGDGLISVEELGICLRSIGFLVSTIDLLELKKKIDPSYSKYITYLIIFLIIDKSGEIDLSRFFMAISLANNLNSKEKENLNEEHVLIKALENFDKHKTGKINVDEFKKILMVLGDVLRENEVFKIIS